jgi:hypothetical protein
MLGPKGGENARGLSSSLFLAINDKGEKRLSPKQKDRTTISKKFEIKFSIDIEREIGLHLFLNDFGG